VTEELALNLRLGFQIRIRTRFERLRDPFASVTGCQFYPVSFPPHDLFWLGWLQGPGRRSRLSYRILGIDPTTHVFNHSSIPSNSNYWSRELGRGPVTKRLFGFLLSTKWSLDVVRVSPAGDRSSTGFLSLCFSGRTGPKLIPLARVREWVD